MRSSGEPARIYGPHARRSHFAEGNFLFACHPVFLPRSSHSFDSAMPFGPAVWLGPTCVVQITSRVGPLLKKWPSNPESIATYLRSRFVREKIRFRPDACLNTGALGD